ncbi:hypothetical protein ABZ589_11950 [Streptomyces sp. NPDC013313]
MTELAYVPVDNAEAHAADIPGEHSADPTGAQAGLYAEPEFTLKHLRP